MKRIILIFSLFVISYSCKAQKNTINSSESTINGIDFLGNNVALVIQHLGQPNTIEDYFFEMDDVMSQKYNYNGLLFYIVNSKVVSFEITANNYAFTSNNIKVGDNISTLQSIYPLSFATKGTDWLGLPFDDIDMFSTIFFNSNNHITKIRLGSY